MEIRRSYDGLISTMGFRILVRWHLYIESGPRYLEFQFQYITLKSHKCQKHRNHRPIDCLLKDFIKFNIRENIKVPHCGPLIMGNQPITGELDSLHKRVGNVKIRFHVMTSSWGIKTYPYLVLAITSPRPYETEDIQYQHRTNSGRHWQVISDVGKVRPDSVEVNHIGSCYHAPTVGGPLWTHCHPAAEGLKVGPVWILTTDNSKVTWPLGSSQVTVNSPFCLPACSGGHQRNHQRSPATGGFPLQRASNVESVSMKRNHQEWCRLTLTFLVILCEQSVNC